MMSAIVKYEPSVSGDPREIFLAAMFLMFMRAPLKRNADVDGKVWTRLTPYSLARIDEAIQIP